MSDWRSHVEAGHRVIALHRITEGGKCGCPSVDCPAAGKHPVARNWVETTPLSVEAAEEAEESGLYSHGYGVIVDGLLVVDVDARNGGVASLAALEDRLGLMLGALAGYIVRTGSGGGSRHLYFEVPPGLSLVSRLAEFPGVDFKTSGYVVGAGSQHASGGRYSTIVGSPYDLGPAPPALLELLRRPDRIRARIGAVVSDISLADIAGALGALSPDLGYDDWIRAGMAIHDATQGDADGFALWDRWSSRGKKYPGASVLSRHWHSFGKSANPVTVGTLFMLALKEGWIRPPHLEPGTGDSAPVASGDGCPVDITGVDLYRPPGFVGELAEWIDKRNLFYRPRLSTIAALVSVGNIGGLRWRDDTTRATANLFAFCVSASATGKDSVLGSMTEIHRAAGVAPAVHGEIKSAQEITRNLIRNQAAFYLADEWGEKLATINNARKRGGAAYLEAVVGDLMKIYSKADGVLLISGDMREEIRAAVMKDIARIERRLDAAPSPELEAELSEAQKGLRLVEVGLERPFLSLIGFSTPSIFGDLMTFEQATSGFLGRCVLVHEPNSNPLPRDPSTLVYELPADLRAAVQMIAGRTPPADGAPNRVEEFAPRREIMTEDTAREALRAVQLWTYSHLAETHRETTGLEAVARRSYELIAKVSLILAIPSGVRTMQHVAWATAYALEDLRAKVRSIYAQDTESAHALSAAILGCLGDEPVTLGVVANSYALRTYARATVLEALEALIAAGRVLKGEKKDGRSKTKTIAVYSLP